MSHRFEDTVECRLDFKTTGGTPHGWAEVYAQAGPHFPLYEDEKWVGDVSSSFLEKHGVSFSRDRADIPLKVRSRQGWDEEDE